MKKLILLLILLFVNIINTKSTSNNDKTSRHNLLRNLWDEDMNIPERLPEEETSLKHCAKSDYKYFSYILSGAPLSYSHPKPASYGGVRK